MASNLNEYYASKGQTLPSVEERASVATQAGITGYVGSKEQNASLLGYLEKTPNQSGNNVITSDNLTPEKSIQVKPTMPDTSAVGMNGAIGALVDTTKNQITADQTEYDKQTQGLAEAMKVSGDTSAFNEKVMKEQGVDTSKKVRDNFLSQIEQEQKSTLDAIEEVKKTFNGTTAGLNAEIARIQRDSANKLANYGIGLSSASRDYETASNIANRLIDANTNKLKADIESRQFVLQQLGTKLATEKSQAFQLQIKQIDREDTLYKDAIKTATDGAKDGTIDGSTAFQAVQDLTSGKISLSDYYSRLGITGNNAGNVNGYDITTYATDPKHEVKVQAIYDTMGNVDDEETATSTIKRLSPSSPITGDMVMESARKYGVDPKLMIAIMQQDSNLGTQGLAVKTKNAGNVGNDDAGNTQEFETWDEGVDAVAKWLSDHKSKGVYKGEFLSTLETVAFATNEPDKTKRTNLQNMKKDISNGDYASAYKKIENTVSKVLTGDNKTQYDAKRIAVPAIEDLKNKLQAYADAGGNTGLLKGTYEKIYNKLGTVADPNYKQLAVDLRIALQRYRKELSGAAFSEQEAQDYESVNPSGNNTLNLNLSILEGMHDNFKRQIDATVDTYAGDGASFIRQYAETGTDPKQKAVETKYSTPTGNGFTIVDSSALAPNN
mgnify:CR=1 FL=1